MKKERRLSKIETLTLAKNYITALTDVIIVMRQGEDVAGTGAGPSPSSTLQLPTTPITPNAVVVSANNMASAAVAAAAAVGFNNTTTNPTMTFNVGDFEGGILQAGVTFKRELRKMGPVNGMEL